FEEMSDGGGDRDVTDVVYHVVNDDTAERGMPDPGRTMREVAPSAPRSRGRALATFTAHYVLGIPEYDESFNILDADATSYIGECGMGYNTKNGILQNNPENVIALDVWLFDKTDEKQLETKTRVLISQHVLDNHLERVFGDPENPDKRPIVAVEERQFALEGSNLVLDCTIERVGHSADGIFQDVVVEMVVSRKR
ncbi:MAG: hypothetical protein KDD78_11480, partial [Caldilineaceae bacterium]|nr:hypothetical protein [Caldilineaceae bacterium]